MKSWVGLSHIQETKLSDILHPTIYKDETGELFLEITPEGVPFIHCYIYKWTKETYKHQKEIWKYVVKYLGERGFTFIYAASKDAKLEHFARMFGFETTEVEILDTHGDVRRVLKCSTN